MTPSVEDLLVEAVAAGVERVLARRADAVEPVVFTIPAAAQALCTSAKAIRRLVAEGVLPTVPHMGARVLIPRSAVVRLVESATTTEAKP